MNRLEKHFFELQQKQQKALLLFITAGDPDLHETLKIMEAMALNGADCIELGIPFSDPIADGPVIQRSTARALQNKFDLNDIFKLVKIFRTRFDVPIVLMGYLNPLIRYGVTEFVMECNKNGIDGLIIADLPYEEGEEIETICKNNEVNLIYLLAPTKDNDRTHSILASSSGFVYCVSHYGTTGTSQELNSQLGEIVQSLKQRTELPVAVGFGISSCEQAKNVAKMADGIIVGSWLVQELEKSNDKVATAAHFTKTLKHALTSAGEHN